MGGTDKLTNLGLGSEICQVCQLVRSYPDKNLEISSLTSIAAFELYQYDIYIGEIFKKDPKYVYKPLKNFKYRFYASHEYIEKYGYPEKVEDLQKHRLIEFNIRKVSGFYKSTDLFEAIHRKGLKKISIDSTMGEYKLATEGAGIACLCEELSLLRDSSLFSVLDECCPIEVQIYFVFHESLRGNKIVISLLNKNESPPAKPEVIHFVDDFLPTGADFPVKLSPDTLHLTSLQLPYKGQLSSFARSLERHYGHFY